jgi:hypothetical protein
MNPEDLPQTRSLFEEHANTEVSLYGLTGKLSELAELCPVPESERTTQAWDRFAARVLQEAGVEIAEEFTYLLEEEARPEPQVHEKRSQQTIEPVKVTEAKTEKTIEHRALEAPVAAAFAPAVATGALEETIQRATLLTQTTRLHEDEVVAPIVEAEVVESADVLLVAESVPIDKEEQPELMVSGVAVASETMIIKKSVPPRLVVAETPVVESHLEVSTAAATVTETDFVLPEVFAGDEAAPYISEAPRTPIVDLELAAETTIGVATHEIAVENVVEQFDVPPKETEQLANIVELIPTAILHSLELHFAEVGPSVVEETKALLVDIAEVADRLHDLALADHLESKEAEQIVAVITELYEDLLTRLGVEYDEATIKQFVALICSPAYVQRTAYNVQRADEGTHEKKIHHFSIQKQLQLVAQRLGTFTIGKLAVTSAA